MKNIPPNCIFKQKDIAETAMEIINKAFRPDPEASSSQDIFEYLFSQDVGAIAGGMPRDHFFSKPATDIDIFLFANRLNCDKEHWGQFIISAFNQKDWQISLMERDSDNHMYSMNAMDVFEFTSPEGMPGNVIISHTGDVGQLMHSFPCNLSKICWLKDETFMHEDFMHGVVNKSLELDRMFGKTDYLSKMLKKFPHFQLRMV